MKKYFIVSDIHSFYTKMIEALEKAGFEQENSEHIIISCGDLLDRGPEPLECLKFMNSMYEQGRAILIRGNHEDLLETLCDRGYPKEHDISNGTWDTCERIAHKRCTNSEELGQIIYKTNTHPQLQKYLSSLKNYFETNNYIFTHAWIPVKNSLFGKFGDYDENWRISEQFLWEEARWRNPWYAYEDKLNQTGKILVFGHWSTSFYWCNIAHETETYTGKYAKYDMVKIDKPEGIIGLDGTIASPFGKINVLVLNEEDI